MDFRRYLFIFSCCPNIRLSARELVGFCLATGRQVDGRAERPLAFLGRMDGEQGRGEGRKGENDLEMLSICLLLAEFREKVKQPAICASAKATRRARTVTNVLANGFRPNHKQDTPACMYESLRSCARVFGVCACMRSSMVDMWSCMSGKVCACVRAFAHACKSDLGSPMTCFRKAIQALLQNGITKKRLGLPGTIYKKEAWPSWNY